MNCGRKPNGQFLKRFVFDDCWEENEETGCHEWKRRTIRGGARLNEKRGVISERAFIAPNGRYYRG